MKLQMIRVISSPSSSTTGSFTLILAISGYRSGSGRRYAGTGSGPPSHPASRGSRVPAEPRFVPDLLCSLGRFAAILFLRRRHHRVRHHAGLLAYALLDGGGHLRMVTQELLGILASLPDPLAVEAEPGAGLLPDVRLPAEIDQLAHLADALTVHDVELDLPERRRHLVLDHLDACLVADDLVALLDLADASYVQPDRGIELQRIAARRRLRAAEHDTDLRAYLVEEDQHGV